MFGDNRVAGLEWQSYWDEHFPSKRGRAMATLRTEKLLGDSSIKGSDEAQSPKPPKDMIKDFCSDRDSRNAKYMTSLFTLAKARV